MSMVTVCVPEMYQIYLNALLDFRFELIFPFGIFVFKGLYMLLPVYLYSSISEMFESQYGSWSIFFLTNVGHFP